MLSHDDPRFVPTDNERAAHARHIARNIPNQFGYKAPAARQVVNLTAAPTQTVRTFGPHKSEVIKPTRKTARWYVAYVPFGMRYRHQPPRYSEPFKSEKAAMRAALGMLDSRDAFRADVVKG